MDSNISTNSAEYYVNPDELSHILVNLRSIEMILDDTSGSDKVLGLSFSHVNNIMKARELIREVTDSLTNSGNNSFDSYDSRTYKKKRW